MVTPVGATGSKVRFARHPPVTAKMGIPNFPKALAERFGDDASIESATKRLAEYQPIRFSMLA
jgi:hypothetical protein